MTSLFWTKLLDPLILYILAFPWAWCNEKLRSKIFWNDLWTIIKYLLKKDKNIFNFHYFNLIKKIHFMSHLANFFLSMPALFPQPLMFFFAFKIVQKPRLDLFSFISKLPLIPFLMTKRLCNDQYYVKKIMWCYFFTINN